MSRTMSSPSPDPAAHAAAGAAAGLSLAAALIHLWVAAEHYEEWWGYGAFFLAAALSQGLGGVFILRWPERQAVPLVGIWGNLAIVALYVLTRTRGEPY